MARSLYVQCFCGDETSDYDQYGESTACKFDCAGDASQTCGGYDAMTVYQSAIGPAPTPPTPTPSPIGCFTDVMTDRIMTLAVETSDMTAAVSTILTRTFSAP